AALCEAGCLLGPQAEQNDIVVERQILAIRAGVALPAAAAAELATDAGGVVHFGADHVHAAQLGDAFAQANVGAATGHVRRDGDVLALARLPDDLSFGGDLPGVQNLVRHAGGR